MYQKQTQVNSTGAFHRLLSAPYALQLTHDKGSPDEQDQAPAEENPNQPE
jgi:hypothetical protein